MARDERKRQQKLERKKAKRREALAQTQAASPAFGFAIPAHAPVHECYVSGDLFEKGMGSAIVSKVASHGQIVWATFLLDTWCLGVKNAYIALKTPSEFQHNLRRTAETSPLVMKPAAYVKKLVLDAEAWARGLGIEPHPDYAEAKRILIDIDAGHCTEQFVFGKDGKPFYYQGPHDSPIKIKHIMNALMRSCGPGRFDYMLRVDQHQLEQIQAMDPNAHVVATERA